MKQTILIIALFALNACNSGTDKNLVNENAEKVNADSLHVDNHQVNTSDTQPDKEFHSCNFENFIADKKTPKLAKEIYLDNEWDLNNDTEALALLDSLTSKNKSSRPFYFKVVTKSYKKSDGYFSEGLGLVGKEYVENNTQEFIANFDNKDCFTANDLTTWAKIAMLEFSMDGEGDNKIIDDYIKKLKSNCINCSPAQQENLNKFALALKKEWKEFFKNTD